jgi:hypothetical protein
MAAIRPFRHLLIYPVMMRELEREWRERLPAERRARVLVHESEP